MTNGPPLKRPAPGLVDRLCRLSGADRALLAEAFALVAMSSAAIRVLPQTYIGRLASLRLGTGRPPCEADLLAKVAWAVRACARRAPFRAVCFQQGLAAQIMLRRRGVDSRLYFGAATDRSDGLAAHVWVRAGDRDVVGCEEAPRFAVLAVYPPASRLAGIGAEATRVETARTVSSGDRRPRG